MQSFLLVATTTGAPLGPEVTARLTAVPGRRVPHEPETRLLWLPEPQHVGFAGWQTRTEVVGGSHWHVGDHGLTAFVGGPWPATGRFGADTSWAGQLTSRLDPAAAPSAASVALVGAYGLVRLDARGAGWVVADPTGAGPLYVAEAHGLVAVSNRPALAWFGAHGDTPAARDVAALAALPATGALAGAASGIVDVAALAAGESVRIDPARGARVDHHTSDDGLPAGEDPVGRAAAQLRDALAGIADLPAPRRVLDLSVPADARVVLAAAVGAGVLDRFELVARATRDGAPPAGAAALAGAVGRDVRLVPSLADDVVALDRWLRHHVGRTGAVVAADPGAGTAIADEGVIVSTAGVAALRSVGHADVVDPAGILTAEARGELPGATSAASPRWAAAEQAASAPATVLDPSRSPALAQLVGAAAGRRSPGDLADEVVRRLVPGLAEVDAGEDGRHLPAWETAYPLLEAELLGRPGGPLDAVLDRAAVRQVLRGAEPTPPVQRSLWAAATAAVWASHGEVQVAVPRRPPAVTVVPRRPSRAPVLITGITSRSFIDLAQLKIPLERTERDPVLAVRVDREVAELTDRLLVAVDAALGDLPADLDERLASEEMAGFADAAVQLLARRGGVLADPRLGLTLPFWSTHVAPPEVVLVAERPTDLLARLERPLPPARLLAAWLDVVAATLTTTDGVRCVDPDDIAEGPLGPQGAAAAADPGPDPDRFEELLTVTSVIDSLIRELEVDAVRPIVRELRRARLVAERGPAAPAGDGRVPLTALDALPELRRRTAELEAELAARTAERDEARARRDELAGRRTVRWAVAAARVLGRPPLDA